MKKFIIVVLSVLAAASCLEQGSFSQSYTANISFEYSEQAYKDFKDSVFVLTEGDAFLYQSFPVFFNQRYTNGTLAGGFALSYLKGEKDGALTKEPMTNDAYRVNAESGNLGSKTYAVFFDNPVASMMPEHDIEFGYRTTGTFSPTDCYVNNTTLVARKVQEHFTDGDKLVLKAIGVRSDKSTVEAAIKLADYTEGRDSVMYNWTAFKLSSLGAVDYIDFKVESTNPNVPGYFCLDNLMAGITIEM